MVENDIKGRIVIVEDNRINAELIKDILEVKGHTIILIDRGEVAFDGIVKEMPDLIFMDIQLPGMDGYKVTKLLKSDKRTKDIPVIALTAYALKGDREKALAAGCDDYVTKPIDTRKLPNVVQAYLSKRKGTVPKED